MTLVVSNDDPRCAFPRECHVKTLNQKACMPCRSAAKVKRMQENAARAATWSPPKACETLYADLKSKLGATQARKLVEEHAKQKGIPL